LIGDWWLTFPAGLLVGVAISPAKLAVPTGALAGLLGWVLPLILTSLVGLLLGLTGAWLASALRGLLFHRPIKRSV
jgi:hypothetical protein